MPPSLDWRDLADAVSAVDLVDAALARAVAGGASDLHFEPFAAGLRLRGRFDGTMVELAWLPAARAPEVAARLKVLANLDVAEQRGPQDGRLRVTVAGTAVDLRLATLPTEFGESVALRVLGAGAGRRDLASLGLPSTVATAVAEVLARPEGLFLVTGPTGCGKTTTLYACLGQVNRPERKVLTVEDPVERELPGLVQVQANAGIGLTFPRVLRAFLRQDPDVVVVGEIRDAETAHIAVQASLTGHLVLSTMHTPDAASAALRLVDMGVEPYLLGSTLLGVLAQRLVRRPCRCGPNAPDDCPACGGSGHRGRTGLFEFLAVDETIRNLITTRGSPDTLRRAAQAAGMQTLREAWAEAAACGEAEPVEAEGHD